jgi:hypothetical protein
MYIWNMSTVSIIWGKKYTVATIRGKIETVHTAWPLTFALHMKRDGFKIKTVLIIVYFIGNLSFNNFTLFICPSLRLDILWYTTVRPFHMSRSNLRTPWPIHFKFHRVIGFDGLTVLILYGEISNFHSRVVGLYSSNCRWFFVCRAVNWEPLGQFTSNFAQLLELIVLRSVYFLVKFRIFIPELWDFIHQIVGDFSYVAL